MKKPSIPKGTRDFGPAEMIRREFLFTKIRDAFRLYGFLPLETPAMEELSTLMGKYGEEGDKLIFKILNSGNYLDSVPAGLLNQSDSKKLTPAISEKALRYDLTVPFARYVVMNQHQISFPFRRYQIQPVWRADRPQKGRYREFYQCDADMIGTRSLLAEVELIQLLDHVFDSLGLRVKVRLNNRKILTGLADMLGESDHLTDITTALDKLDKAGREEVESEMVARGVGSDSVIKLRPLLDLNGTSAEKLAFMRIFLKDSDMGISGLEELETVLNYVQAFPFRSLSCSIDFSLARGLNYYTGAIIEVNVDDERSSFKSSICGGGRYDDLTGIFGLPGLSGVGISFGADRIVDVLEEAGLFPESASSTTRVLIANFGGEEEAYALRILHDLRSEGIPSEIYPEPIKMKKQFSYADDLKIPFVVLPGETERLSASITVKDMANGSQFTTTFAEWLLQLKK